MKKIFFVAIFLFFCLSSFKIEAQAVGEKRNFFIDPVYDLNNREELNAVLVKTTPQLYFYADESWWNFSPQNEISQILTSLGEEFEKKIYPDLTSAFGTEWIPGIDRDLKITILIHPMRKDVSGYFSPKDEYSKLQVVNSNEREIIYLSSDHIKSSLAKSFLAHEFVHLTTFNQKEKIYGVEEETWLNEARAEYASTLLGYDDIYEGSNLQKRVQIFSDDSFDSITEWQNTKYDYAAINLFTQYLVDHYGKEVLTNSLHSPKVGIDSLNYALANRKINKNFSLLTFLIKFN